jgi:hypothetical protein
MPYEVKSKTAAVNQMSKYRQTDNLANIGSIVENVGGRARKLENDECRMRKGE